LHKFSCQQQELEMYLNIILSKLAAYGLSSQSVKLLESYLTGRKQQFKIQGVVSGCQILQKGVKHINNHEKYY
jgi:hypothetical protein